jgi:hypothetical protein
MPRTTSRPWSCRTCKRVIPTTLRCILRSCKTCRAGWRRPTRRSSAASSTARRRALPVSRGSPLALLHLCAVWQWRRARRRHAQPLQDRADSGASPAAAGGHAQDGRDLQSGRWMVGLLLLCRGARPALAPHRQSDRQSDRQTDRHSDRRRWWRAGLSGDGGWRAGGHPATIARRKRNLPKRRNESRGARRAASGGGKPSTSAASNLSRSSANAQTFTTRRRLLWCASMT